MYDPFLNGKESHHSASHNNNPDPSRKPETLTQGKMGDHETNAHPHETDASTDANPKNETRKHSSPWPSGPIGRLYIEIALGIYHERVTQNRQS
jgi:hypothetical protein